MICLVYRVQQEPVKIANENCIFEKGYDKRTGY